ncbi:hypothetical protein J3Q64DRAFT_1850277 [Phycomyces blakesleeanus]
MTIDCTKAVSMANSSFENLQSLFVDFVQPQLVQRKKQAGVIFSAVVLVLCYNTINKIIYPPKSLRHIPHVNYIAYTRSQLRKQPASEQARELLLPLLAENNGFYAIPFLGKWSVQVANPIAIKTILLKFDMFPKANSLSKSQGTLAHRFIGGPNVFLLEGKKWRKQRMISNPAFSRSMPVDMFGRITINLFKYLDNIDPTIDVLDTMKKWTLDTLGSAVFDFDFESLTKPNNEWTSIYYEINASLFVPIFNILPVLEKSFLWMFPKRKRVHDKMTKLKDMMRQVIIQKQARLKENKPNPNLKDTEKDLLTLLLESENEGHEPMSEDELMSNLCAFFFAGHDTTANALSSALYHLAVQQDVQKKAREEVINVLGDEPEDVIPSIEDTRQLDYLNLIIKENMRINPPVGGPLDRLVTEDIVLDGVLLPKGTSVKVAVYSLHRNPLLWDSPEEFRPERFLPGGEADKIEGMGYIPFSDGGRQCIGMNFSLVEQRVLLAMMLRKYTWKLSENTINKDELQVYAFNIMAPFDLKITLEKRY